jgi:hypothetical protein
MKYLLRKMKKGGEKKGKEGKNSHVSEYISKPMR